MTAVEFYDRTPVENAISSLTTVPDKIIYIGDENNLKRFKPTFDRFLTERGLTVQTDYRAICKEDLADIIDKLVDILKTERDVVFDLTGGEDLVLVAMGMVFEKYRDTYPIQMQWFHVRGGTVVDCDNDGRVIFEGLPILTVEEQVALHGGAVRYAQDDRKEDGTYAWRFTPDFARDVDVMWSICRQDPSEWNKIAGTLGAIHRYNGGVGLSAWADLTEIDGRMSKGDDPFYFSDRLMRQFERVGWITDYRLKDGVVSFSYKDESVKRCLIKAGTLLEVKTLLMARRLSQADGTPYYTDSLSGVCIDWDGTPRVAGQTADTENEIDVVLMKGLVPVFISCKNGYTDTEELYKFQTVTDRFGGKYAKRVLIANRFGNGEDSAEAFRRRARDMKIRLIEDIYDLEDPDWNDLLRSLVNE